MKWPVNTLAANYVQINKNGNTIKKTIENVNRSTVVICKSKSIQNSKRILSSRFQPTLKVTQSMYM